MNSINTTAKKNHLETFIGVTNHEKAQVGVLILNKVDFRARDMFPGIKSIFS